MSIWQRIRTAFASLRAGEPLSAVLDRLSVEPERTVAFTIAVIALGAKMAKADGRVTHDEIDAFKQIFSIAPRDEPAAARVYNTPRTDIAGFDVYAKRVKRMFHDRPDALADVLEGLVFIAMADGEYHPHEQAFLEEVARIFDVPEAAFSRIKARHMPDGSDPYLVVGVSPEADDDEIRTAYRARVRELHPDSLIARGLPEEAARLAEMRLASINAAYDRIRRERAGAEA